MKKLEFSLLISTIVLLIPLNCLGGWRELKRNEPFILERPAHGDTFAILSRQPNGNLFYIDTERRVLRVKRANGSILEFNTNHLREKYMINITLRDRNARNKLFRQEPVLWGISNMKSFSKGVALFHRVQVPGRSVQFVDENLKIIGYWEDITLRSRIRIPEAVAVASDGRVIALGEKGEILEYDLDGSVIGRIVIPGLFNESRKAKINPFTEEKLMYSDTKLFDLIAKSDAERTTKAIAKRDNMLPDLKLLSGPEMPSYIKALAVTDDDHILVMDDFNIYDIDKNQMAINLLNLPNMKFSEGEELLGVSVEGSYISILTRSRLITSLLNPIVIGEQKIPPQFAYEKVPWTYKPPDDKGIVLFSDMINRKFEEVKID